MGDPSAQTVLAVRSAMQKRMNVESVGETTRAVKAVIIFPTAARPMMFAGFAVEMVNPALAVTEFHSQSKTAVVSVTAITALVAVCSIKTLLWPNWIVPCWIGPGLQA